MNHIILLTFCCTLFVHAMTATTKDCDKNAQKVNNELQNNDELNFWHLHATNLTSDALDEFNALFYNDSLNWDEKLQGYRAWSEGKGEHVKAAYELWEARMQRNINEALTTIYRSAEETLSAEAMVIYKQIARNNQHSFERLVWQYLNAPNSVTSITVKQELVMFYRGFEELWKQMIEN